ARNCAWPTPSKYSLIARWKYSPTLPTIGRRPPGSAHRACAGKAPRQKVRLAHRAIKKVVEALAHISPLDVPPIIPALPPPPDLAVDARPGISTGTIRRQVEMPALWL